ncbi:MAG: hypothetical protein J7647_08670 [Cyanobacteria bacterium SBLK]|nr:hypothetical protein [Cyanobacteria bacterium SBLK]
MLTYLRKLSLGMTIASLSGAIALGISRPGQAQYIITLPDGSRCEGQFQGYTGQGICEYEDGYYRGQILNGLRHGRGLFYFRDRENAEADINVPEVGTKLNEAEVTVFAVPLPSGNYVDVYEGDFRNGFPNGRGSFIYGNDMRYDGEVKDGLPHGTGLFIYGSEGEYSYRYYGQVAEGLANGRGSFVYATCQIYRDKPHCDRYDGQFRNGLPHGQGTFTYSECAVVGQQVRCKRWSGQFFKGQPNGAGTLIFANGDRCQGQFNDLTLSGRGNCSYSNGNRYSGELRDGQPHGMGTMRYSDGRTYSGEFRGGNPIGSLGSN